MAARILEFDSSYRDRTLYPLPARFDLLTDSVNTNLLNLVSPQTILFPPQGPVGATGLEWAPVAFFNQTFPQNTTPVIEARHYLPYMYAVTDTLLRLDELPIASTSETTTEIVPASDIPSNTFRLGAADNYYVDNHIELVATGETRRIVGFEYSTDDIVLQVVTMVSYYVDNDKAYIQLDDFVGNAYPPSNVDRFYQGKYVQLTDGTTRLIVNYFLTPISSTPTLELASPLQEVPIVPQNVSIVAKESWLARIESPFSTFIPPYPAYQGTVPSDNVLYSKIPIWNTTKVFAIDIVRLADDTIGVVYQTLTRVLWVRSTDTAGTEWVTPPVLVATGTFADMVTHGISAAIINGNPAIVYCTTNRIITYVRASNATGTAWNAPQVVNATVILAGSVPSVQDVQFSAQPGSVILRAIPGGGIGGGAPFTDVGYPQIVFASPSDYESDQQILLARGDTSYDAPTWRVLQTWEDAGFTTPTKGVVGDMAMGLGCTSADYVDLGLTDPELQLTYICYRFVDSPFGVGILMSDPALADTFMLIDTYQSEPIDGVPKFGQILSTVNEMSPGDPPRVCAALSVVWRDTDDIIHSAQGIPFDFSTYRSLAFGLSPLYALATNELPISANNLLVTSYPNATDYQSGDAQLTATYLSGKSLVNVPFYPDGIFVDTNYVVDTVQMQPVLPETGTVYASLVQLPATSSAAAPVIVYQSQDNAVMAAVPMSITFTEGSQYRIRQSQSPIAQGSVTAGTTTTIDLTGLSANAAQLERAFVWVYARPTDPIATNFVNFSEYRKIISYDASTQVATVGPPFSASLDALLADGNDLVWEILGLGYDGSSSLRFVGTTVNTRELVCYDVQLLSLILPNVQLSTGEGNRIAFYPYVYVELMSLSASNVNLLVTNNPNATRALFKVPITNTVDPDRSSFVTLSGVGAVQTIKFRVDDTFAFRVLLPNGEVFQTLLQDPQPPLPINPNIQVSAMFQVKRRDDSFTGMK